MHDTHRTALETKHAGIDQQIAAEARRPAPDDAAIRTLKKQKLRIKEALRVG